MPVLYWNGAQNICNSKYADQCHPSEDDISQTTNFLHLWDQKCHYHVHRR
jgi:hypothetical protein